VSPFGLALTPFVAGAGLLLLGFFKRWTERRIRLGLDPLVHLKLFGIRPLKAGLQMFLAQNLILMGVFFSIPLYLQVVQGLDALETGMRMLPVSVAMFIMSFVGARMSQNWTPRQIVRAGLWVLLGSIVMLIGAVDPEMKNLLFALSMAALGVGMGLLASQLGNVVQSSVGTADRSEAGGLQYTAQQLGSAMGTAFIGAIVISALATVFVNQISSDPAVSDAISTRIGVQLNGTIEFVPAGDLESYLATTPLDQGTSDAIVDAYELGQIRALRTGLLAAALIVILSLFIVRRIPDMSFEELAAAAGGNTDPPQS